MQTKSPPTKGSQTTCVVEVIRKMANRCCVLGLFISENPLIYIYTIPCITSNISYNDMNLIISMNGKPQFMHVQDTLRRPRIEAGVTSQAHSSYVAFHV